jgi:acyl-CoA synthetase (AMP-forming)/AMP-acid ligase II
MLQKVVDHPALTRFDLSSVRTFLYGASPVSQALLERAMRAFPRAAFVQLYGMTEAAGTTAMLGPDEHRAGQHLRAAGRAAAHAEVRIVDDENNELPRGTVGEIACRGGHIISGYWNRPEETAEALPGGWLHTGDAGYIDDDGYLYVVDRVKDMIVTGGENVYSAEVENAITSHPAVASCAVIAIPDPVWGERVHAVVMLRPGRTASAEEIREHCKTLIAGYKAPRSCEFVNSLPLSAAGKVLKRELRRPYWADTDRAVH